MKILTEAEYERRLEKARNEGYERRCEELRRDAMQDDFWRAIRDNRQSLDRAIMELRERMNRAGIPDPFEPKVACSNCSESVPTTPGVPGY